MVFSATPWRRVRALSEKHERVSLDALRREAERITGRPLASLDDSEL